jgi:hypothetical protein
VSKHERLRFPLLRGVRNSLENRGQLVEVGAFLDGQGLLVRVHLAYPQECYRKKYFGDHVHNIFEFVPHGWDPSFFAAILRVFPSDIIST